jgi:hypothetical protein
MSANHLSSIQFMPQPIDHSHYSTQIQSSDTDNGVVAVEQDVSKTDIHLRLERLFAFLQVLNKRFYHRPLRSLVQECEEKGIEHLLQVRQLDLACCKLQEIPEDIGLLTNLQFLHLTGNQLTTLPLSLLPLAKNLRSLHLGSNQLKNIPEVVNQIAMQRIAEKKYFELFLKDNPMKEVSRSLRPVVHGLPHFGSYYVD